MEQNDLEAMLNQLIEWNMLLVYIRDKLERGEDVDVDQYAEFLAAVDSAIDKMNTSLVLSLSIHGANPN